MRLLTVDVPFTGAFSTIARSGSSLSGVWDVGVHPDDARTADSTYLSTTVGPLAGSTRTTEHLQGVGFTTPVEATRYRIHRIGVKVTANAGGTLPDTTDVRTDDVFLVKGGVILTTVYACDAVTARQWAGVETKTYWFSAGNLETLGVTRLDLLNNPADFGAAIAFLEDDSASSAGLFALVDYVGLVFEYLLEDESMDYMQAAKSGGWSCLLEEALPSVVASTALFANAPKGTQFIRMRIITADLVINNGTRSFNDSTNQWEDAPVVVTTSTGLLYFANERVILPLNHQQAKLCRAIQSGGTTTGWIEYWGRNSE